MTLPANFGEKVFSQIGPAGAPSRIRFLVAAMVYLMAMITYLDRACLATLAPILSAEFALTKVQLGYVFSAFALAYGAFELPTARWADRCGTRRVLGRIVIGWSALTMATAAATGFISLVAVRFLFGMGEAGAWPCAARTFSRWFPVNERGRIQGAFFASAHLAGGLTPFLVTFLLGCWNWRVILLFFGVLGLAWAAAWLYWFRDEPQEHAAVNLSERALIAAGRGPASAQAHGRGVWRRTFSSRNVRALCVVYFPNSFTFYFCITWFPVYLREKHGFSATTLSFFTGLPLLLSVAADLGGGFASDWLTARFGPQRGRCALGAGSYLLAGLVLLATPWIRSPIMAATAIAVATAACMFTLAAAWSVSIEIDRDNAAVVSAAMNTAGQAGSFCCPLVVAYSLKWYGNWNITIGLMGGLFLIGALAWRRIDLSPRAARQ